MSLPLPDIDNLDFDKLVEQARLMIPRYAEEWTDHNVHDPGMTLIELAAWIVDQQVYSAGFVSDEHLAAFAALLGVRPQAASAARGLVWPDANAIPRDPTIAGTDLPAGSRVVSRQTPDVIFRTVSNLHLSPARMIDPPDWRRIGLTETVFELSFDRPLVETTADGVVPVGLGVQIDLPRTASTGAEGRISVDYRIENDAVIDPWQRLDVESDSTAALNTTGVIRFRVPGSALTPRMRDKRRSRLRLRSRYRNNPLTPVITRVGLNVIDVEQRQYVPAAAIGTGNGQPDQVALLDLAGMDPDEPPGIEIAENNVFVRWQARDSLLEAGPDDRAFVLDTRAGRVRFGNGVNGRVPAAGAQIRHVGYYRTAGAAGNLTSGLDWSVRGALLANEAVRFGTNPIAMTGGQDEWTMKRLRAAAREQATRRRGRVTNEDLQEFGEQLRSLGVESAEVLTGFDPARPFAQLPNSRTLLVTPEDAIGISQRRYVSAVNEVVSPGRILGERLLVAIKREQPVDIRAGITIADGALPGDVVAAVRRVLQARLSRRRRSQSIDPWPSGRHVQLGELETIIARVDNVVSVVSCVFGRQGEAMSTEPVYLEADTIAVLGALDIDHELVAGDDQ